MSPEKAKNLPATMESIQEAIQQIRGQRVMLDEDLALLYGVETKVLNQAVRRNPERFPEDFMIQLTEDEWDRLRSQVVTSNTGRGGRRYPPFAFTQEGVAMLSSVLNSERAIRVNVEDIVDGVDGVVGLYVGSAGRHLAFIISYFPSPESRIPSPDSRLYRRAGIIRGTRGVDRGRCRVRSRRCFRR